MAAVLFTNAGLLAGLGALAIPVIVHLLLRRRTQRLRFSTIRFFAEVEQQTKRRRKLKNWLLLAVRLLLLALIVLAFTRPYLRQDAAGANAPLRRQIVFLVDRSASMNADGPGGPHWTQAKAAITKALSALQPGDRAALVSCAARCEVLSEFAPPEVIAKLVEQLQPAPTAGELGDALRLAARILALTAPRTTNSLCIVSDLQRSSCRALASFPIPNNADVKIIPIGDLLTPNLAVADLKLQASAAAQPQATIASFSDETSKPFAAELLFDGKPATKWQITLAAGAQTNLALSSPRLAAGWHSAELRIRISDSLALDNARFQTLFVPEPIRLLLVEPRQVPKLFLEETFFVASALDPSHGLSNGAPTGFALEKVTPAQLTARLASSSSRRQEAQASASPLEVVMLPGLKQVPPDAIAALKSFLDSGGGLLIFLNDAVSANFYNAELRDLLPVELGQAESVKDTPWRLREFQPDAPMFAVFRQPNSGNLAIPEFTRRFAANLTAGAAVRASFDDGVPLIAERRVGAGRVVWVNTSADTAWSDWPKHKTFVPWLHAVARYLSGRAGAASQEQWQSFTAGDDIPLDLGASAKGASLTLRREGAREVALNADENGHVRDADFEAPGVYSLRDASGRELRRFAVNAPVAESDLAAMTANDFEQHLARTEPPREPLIAEGLFGESNHEKELWRVLLLAALVLLFLELLLANRTLA
ncbi:MAG: VWA domain-containing protein [Verrucomicrobia bacterium]|nr:VWA domain-containing protein [Verrucomicrobiota bacterium]